MEERKRSGFEEIEHTADWALKVWAPDLEGLIQEAARGMFALMGVVTHSGMKDKQVLSLAFTDRESLLVSFLSELLYWLESENRVYTPVSLVLSGQVLDAELEGASLAHQDKEIKAVTYHNLAVREVDQGLEVTIVFDV